MPISFLSLCSPQGFWASALALLGLGRVILAIQLISNPLSAT
jgi:hypothetical protein